MGPEYALTPAWCGELPGLLSIEHGRNDLQRLVIKNMEVVLLQLESQPNQAGSPIFGMHLNIT